MTGTDRFWFVWRNEGGYPFVRHPTETAAYAEANRLAMRHPGSDFYVLEAVGRVRGSISVETEAIGVADRMKGASAVVFARTPDDRPARRPPARPGLRLPPAARPWAR